MSRYMSFVLYIALFIGCTLASSCTSPKVEISSFSTQDATILTQVAHVAEFTLKCGNNAKPNLFAEFSCGKVVPVARVGEGKYQVCFL